MAPRNSTTNGFTAIAPRRSSGTAMNIDDNNTATPPLQVPPSSRRVPRPAIAPAPSVLPSEKIYEIQVGSKTFRLSGMSLNSDGPSKLSNYFQDHDRLLFIDRDPEVFALVAKHLQGYSIRPNSSTEFTYLLADTIFYGLPRLLAHLRSLPLFLSVGGREFAIAKPLLLQEGVRGSFFTLTHGYLLENGSPNSFEEWIIPGSRARPPTMPPTYLEDHDADLFHDITVLLKGCMVEIRNEEHRQNLLKEIRYFRLPKLESMIIPAEVTDDDITMRLRDIKPNALSVDPETGYVMYARPYKDKTPRQLILQLEQVKIDSASGDMAFEAEDRQLLSIPTEALKLGSAKATFPTEMYCLREKIQKSQLLNHAYNKPNIRFLSMRGQWRLHLVEPGHCEFEAVMMDGVELKAADFNRFRKFV